MCRSSMRPVVLLGIWPEASDAGHSIEKNFSLDSLTADLEFNFWIASQNFRKFLNWNVILKFWPACPAYLWSKPCQNDRPHSQPWRDWALPGWCFQIETRISSKLCWVAKVFQQKYLFEFQKQQHRVISLKIFSESLCKITEEWIKSNLLLAKLYAECLQC